MTCDLSWWKGKSAEIRDWTKGHDGFLRNGKHHGDY
jgi:hypothetical protein